MTIRSRKLLALAVSAAVAGTSLTASTGAQAFPIVPKKPIAWGGGYKPGFGGGYGWGPAAAGLGAAVLVGSLAVAAGAQARTCAIAYRPAVDDLGNRYAQRVRVCD